ncbi:MAG TPA: adenylate kinase [Bacillota bacterium]
MTDAQLCLVFMGPPGVGKGTQAARLAERRGVPHVSTGEMFRRAIRAGTPMGQKAQPYVESGSYVPDDVVNGVVAERLGEEDCRPGFILDGFPRTVGQAEALDAILAAQGRALDAVVYLVVDDDVVLRRLTGRRICPQCGATYHIEFEPPRVAGRCDACGAQLVQRDDDREETVRRRLEVYRQQTTPLVEHYRRQGLLAEVDGEGSVQEVADRIDAAIRGRRSS